MVINLPGVPSHFTLPWLMMMIFIGNAHGLGLVVGHVDGRDAHLLLDLADFVRMVTLQRRPGYQGSSNRSTLGSITKALPAPRCCPPDSWLVIRLHAIHLHQLGVCS